MEACCRDVGLSRWSKGWKEGDRLFMLECRENGTRRFLFCKVVTTKSKSFSLVFSKGKGNHGGSFILDEKLRSLGVVHFFEENVDL